MGKSIQELIAAKQKEIASKKGRQRAFKFPIGKTKIRLLPSWRDGDLQFWHDFGTHYIKDEKGETTAIYVCTEKTYGKDCDICKAIGMGIKNAHDDETIERMKDANAGQQYLMNMIVRGEGNEEPVLAAVGINLFSDICDIIEEYDDITDLESGIDLTVNREGSGRNDTKYSVIPAAKSAKVSKSVMTKAINLDEYVAQENEAQLNKALVAITNSAGLLAVARPSTGIEDKTSSKSIADELGDDIVEAEYSDDGVDDELNALTEPLESQDDSDDDDSDDDVLGDAELDELLGDLEV